MYTRNLLLIASRRHWRSFLPRNGEGGTEDAYAMGELAAAWTSGFQSPRPPIGKKGTPMKGERKLLQAVITLKHMAVNSLENTAPFNRHNFDANITFGIDPFVLSDYYFRPFPMSYSQGPVEY